MYILKVIEDSYSGVSGDLNITDICVSNDKDKLLEYKNILISNIKEYQDEIKENEVILLKKYSKLRISPYKKSEIEKKEFMELEKKLKTKYSNLAKIDIDRFRFVNLNEAQFEIEEIKEIK